MVFPLGVGAGDFVIVLGLVTKVVKALKKSGGAASEYQEVTLELESLSRVLDHVGSRHDTSSIAENQANDIRELVLSCQRPLEQFLDKIESFEASLGVTTGRGFARTSPRKIRWTVFLSSEVPELRSLVAAKVLQLDVLLQSFSFEATGLIQTKIDEVERKVATVQETVDLKVKACEEALAIADKKSDRRSETVSSQLGVIDRCQNRYFPILLQYVKSIQQAPQNVAQIQRKHFSRVFSAFRLIDVKIDELNIVGAQILTALRTCTWPEEIRELLKNLCETNAQIYNAILQLQRNTNVSRPFSIQDGIDFEDGLGRVFKLPYEFFCNWKMVQTLLEVQFENKPGEENIRTGNFYLFSDKAQSRLVKKEEWSRVIFPGARVLMSMILSSMAVFGDTCPKGCDALGENIQQNSTSLICCGLHYNLLDMLAEPRAQATSNETDSFQNSDSLGFESRAAFSDRTRNVTEMRHFNDEQNREIQALESFKRVHINIVPEPHIRSKSSIMVHLHGPNECVVTRMGKFDLGVRDNVMSRETFNSLGVKKERYDGALDRAFVNPDGEPFTVLGMCRVDWHISGRKKTYSNFVVVELPFGFRDILFSDNTIAKSGIYKVLHDAW